MRALDAGILVCGECHALNRAQPEGGDVQCHRCGAAVLPRRRNSLSRTWALLLTAFICYIPANLLPIMSVNMLGQGSPSTIMSGVVVFLQHGSYLVGGVIFVASILVPTFKLVGMALLLYSIQSHQRLSARQRILMFRFIEWIGRWSMIDIFVIAVLVALVNFGQLASIEAGPGAIAFSCVVILTMFAARTFEPRLIWDNTSNEHD